MEVTSINLDKLLSFIETDPHCEAFAHKSQEGSAFGKLVVEVASNIPDEKGLYIWGAFNDDLRWRSVYVGKAHKQKTNSLKVRIVKELKNERAALWQTVHQKPEEFFVDRWLHHYREREGANGSRRHVSKALRKRDTRYIIAVSTPDLTDEDIPSVEAWLIRKFQPSANRQRPVSRPELDACAEEVANAFQTEIEALRSTVAAKLETVAATA